MTVRFSKALGLVASVFLASTAFAQDSSNRVSANTDWSVFEESSPRECWSVSAPKETVNTRDGNVVAVRRGEILLMVFYRPGENVTGQVAFTGGYPFAGGSTVSIDISGTTFQLFSEGEWAWPATSEDDAAIVAAMKRGSEAILVGRSGRGTVTTDKFSLLGFTASVEEAARRCTG
jgi:hypothetical protein